MDDMKYNVSVKAMIGRILRDPTFREVYMQDPLAAAAMLSEPIQVEDLLTVGHTICRVFSLGEPIAFALVGAHDGVVH